MPTVLFTWELGAGFGHLMPYHALAKSLHDDGFTVVFAVSDVERAKNVFSGSNVIVTQAPVNMAFDNIKQNDAIAFPDILSNYGYLNVTELSKAIAAWRILFAEIKPDVVVVDHCPTSLLALRGLPTPRVLAGIGFACPPDTYPLPVLRDWLDVNLADVCTREDQVLGAMNAALGTVGAEPLQNLGQLFSDVDEIALLTLPELDHYRAQRKNGKYWGRFPLTASGVPDWPAGVGPRIFVYLKYAAEQTETFLKTLHQTRCRAIVFLDSAPDLLPDSFSSDNVRIERKFLDLNRICQEVDFAIANGGHGTVTQFLLAGKPLLLIPHMLEAFILCRGLHQLKLGIAVNFDNPAEFKPKLDELLNNPVYAAEARKFAARYANLDPVAQGVAFVRRIEELARSTPDAERFNFAKGGAAPAGTDFQLASQLHQSGQIQRAIQIYQAILANDPLDFRALHLLGFAMLQLNKPERAASLIGRAIALNPAEPAFHNNQGEAFRVMDRWEHALACYRTALRLNPSYANAACNLGLVYQAQGNHDEAIRAFQQALRINPAFAMACNNLGVALLNKGEKAEAVKTFQRALEIDPALGDVHCNLGQVLLELNQLDQAIVHCRKGVELRPNLPAAHNNLGNALREVGQIKEARLCYAAALKLNPNLALTCSNIGQILQEEGSFQEAGQWYQRALNLDPNSELVHTHIASFMRDEERDEDAAPHIERALELNPRFALAHCLRAGLLADHFALQEAHDEFRKALALDPAMVRAHSGLADVLQKMGRFAEANASLREAMRLDPRHVTALGQLATHLRDKLPDADLAAIHTLLDSPTLVPNRRPPLLHGLAEVYDAKGDYARAATCLAEAHRIRKERQELCGLAYQPEQHVAFIDTLIAAFTPEFFARTKGLGLHSTRPVFVLGLPRSGTTLVEQILASHSQIHGAGEQRLVRESFDSIPTLLKTDAEPIDCVANLSQPSIRQLAQEHLNRLARLSAAADHVVNKLPDNYLYIGFILTLFPNAKIIHCRRDVRDIAVSCWMTNFRQIRWSADMDHIAGRIAQHQRIMNHWRSVVPGRFIEVDYEETVVNLEGTARRMLDYVGVTWEPACLDFHATSRPVQTASVSQVRQPIYTRSVQRWKNYESALAPLFEKITQI